MANLTNLAALFQGLMSPINEGLEKKHVQEQKLKDEERRIKAEDYNKILLDPNVSQEYRDKAGQELNKLYNPETKKAHGKVMQIFQGLSPLIGAQKPQTQLSQPNLSNIAGAYGPSYQSPKDATIAAREKAVEKIHAREREGPRPGQSQKDFDKEISQMYSDAEFVHGGAGKFQPPAKLSNYQQKRQDILADYQLLHPEASEEQAGKFLANLEVQGLTNSVQGVLKPTAFILNAGDPQEKTVFGLYSAKEGKFYGFDHKEISLPEGARPVAAGDVTRLYANQGTFISLQDAQKRVLNGEILYGPGEKPYTIEELKKYADTDPHFTLYPVAYDKTTGRVIHDIGPPQGKLATIGNRTYAFSQPELMEGAQGTPGVFVDLGPKQPGTERSSTTNLTKGTTETETTPRAPGIQGLPGPQAPQAAPSSAAPQGGAPQPLSRPNVQGAQPRGGDVKVPPGLAGRLMDRYTAVTEPASQIFGSGEPGEVAPFASYKDLVNSPGSQERLGKAIQLTFDGLSDMSGGPRGEARIGMEKLGFSFGRIGDLVSYRLGLPQALQETESAAKAATLKKSIDALTDREKEYYDATMTAYSTVVGLRRLTGQSPAQFSVEALEREVPLIGKNVKNQKDWADQLARLARVVYNGMNTPGAQRMFSANQVNAVRKYMNKEESTSAPASKENDIIKRLKEKGF